MSRRCLSLLSYYKGVKIDDSYSLSIDYVLSTFEIRFGDPETMPAYPRFCFLEHEKILTSVVGYQVKKAL